MKSTFIHRTTDLFIKAFNVLQQGGIRAFCIYLYKKFLLYGRGYFSLNNNLPSPERNNQIYLQWIKQNEDVNASDIKEEIIHFQYRTKISIITPVYNVDPKWLDICIQSIINQYYDNWELCLHDDASTNKKTLECIRK